MNTTRQTIWRFLAGVAALLTLLASMLLSAAPADARVPSVNVRVPSVDVAVTAAQGPDIVPDLALVITGVTIDQVRDLIPALDRIDGVTRATFDEAGDGSTVIYIAVVEHGGSARPVDAVLAEAERLIANRQPAAGLRRGGSALVDDSLSSGFQRSAMGLALLAGAIGVALGVVFGPKRGAVVALTMAVAVYCGGNLGAQIAGPFDGTVTTTALPGALAGLVAAFVTALRLLLWFRGPKGPDGADSIRRSVLDLTPEFVPVLAAMMVAALLVELANPGRSPLTVVTVSALVAMLVVAAVLAPALTVLQDEPETRPGLLPLSVPDGRDFPLLVLSATALILLALSLFGFGSPNRWLMDDRLLGDGDSAGDEAAMVVQQLAGAGGDATSALLVDRGNAAPADFTGWAAAVAERSEVAWVDTAAGRFRATGPVPVEGSTLLVPSGDPRAVVVLADPARSVEAQELAARLAVIPLADGPPHFAGDPVDSAGIAGSSGPIALAVVALAATAGAAIYVVTQNRANALLGFFLRLIGGAATLGIFRLMVTDATMAESLTALALLALVVGLFEAEFLRQQASPMAEPGRALRAVGPMAAEHGGDAVGAVSDQGPGTVAEPNPGQCAGMALVVLGGAGLVISILAPFGGGIGTGQFGLGLLVATVIELLIGLALLRPALLGQRAAFHTAARPVRVALHAGNDGPEILGLGAEDPAWRRTVADLLQAEFRFQSDPTEADLATVFVPDTPLYRQAETHHQNLSQANLRIVGRTPQLRSLKTVSGRTPVTLAVTVDHPPRQLVDSQGKVVGVRKPERRSGVLWLTNAADGSFRIAESVELGTVLLPESDDGMDDQVDGDADHQADAMIGGPHTPDEPLTS